MSRIVGITGGIGSGKTTVARFFEQQGVPVYYADDRAKVVSASEEVSGRISGLFGDEVLTDGVVDRKKLAAVVFASPEKLASLNAIVHPAVKEDFIRWKTQNANAPILMREAAILFESGSYKDCDKIILVTAPEEIRIRRVIDRSGLTREEVQSRMSSQWSDDRKMFLSDFVIFNNDLEDTRQQALEILKILQDVQ